MRQPRQPMPPLGTPHSLLRARRSGDLPGVGGQPRPPRAPLMPAARDGGDLWSLITGYGGYEGLTMPARGTANYWVPGGDFGYIEVSVTGLRDGTGAAPPEGRAR
jgi:hypothetical protein